MAIASRSCRKRSMAVKVSSRLFTRVLEDCKLRRKFGLCVHGHKMLLSEAVCCCLQTL